jgi:hypothetical protein
LTNTPDTVLNTRVNSYIKRGLKRSKINYSYDDIIEMFELKEPFINWDLYNAIEYGWIYSFAIAFARGKKVFCLDILSHTLMQQQEDFSVIERIAEKENLIVLISTDIYSIFMVDITRFNYKDTELR